MTDLERLDKTRQAWNMAMIKYGDYTEAREALYLLEFILFPKN